MEDVSTRSEGRGDVSESTSPGKGVGVRPRLKLR